MNFRRILFGLGGVASLALGTYLIVFALLDMGYGPIENGFLAIFPARAFSTGRIPDLFLIGLGITLWALGIDSLLIAFRKETPTRVKQLMAPVAVGYGVVAISIAGVRFFGIYELAFLMLVVTAFWAVFYLHVMWRRSKDYQSPQRNV